MAYTFKKFSDVEALTEVPEGANALIEINGAVKRVPGSGLGGGNGIKTAIIKDSAYDGAISGVSTYATAAPQVTYSCINMTFEEVCTSILAGEPVTAFFMLAMNGATICGYGFISIAKDSTGSPVLVIVFQIGSEKLVLYWTADGLSTTPPASGK